MEEPKYLTVTALTKYIKKKFDIDRHLKQVLLQGEISNFKHHSRGHMYFTIKDQQTRISAVMFASHNQTLAFKPEDGMKVLIQGDVTVYERTGQYQVYVQRMEPDGLGALYQAYEQLKKKLDQEGLFEEKIKQSIPQFPEKLGVITSPTGAAVRDIMTTINRRFPQARRVVIPASVQGEQAGQSVANAINYANEVGDFDTLIVGRGGGSIEELWAFNEEVVARSIFHSDIPIISAVGHETDYTIADFVADLRAPTPTAAAELAVPSQDELSQQLHVIQQRIQQQMGQRIRSETDRLQRLKQAYAFKYPVQLTQQKEQDLDRALNHLNRNMKQQIYDHKQLLNRKKERLLANSPQQLVNERYQSLITLKTQLIHTMNTHYRNNVHQLDRMVDKLELLNPMTTMKRGYSITYNESGNIVKSIEKVSLGEQIDINLSDGSLYCEVQKKAERTED
ncbi:exodeoxyribonuclease VII large subunit [Alkalibacillus almallahensis]|uniref:exodeoxyribonuclease VII large subunit n=1 Tax=Alkalibacillus almallahensis TaxID=1379154 RepID=UPI0014213EFC|nr:exodeoxyribonuclease VII large subunit [Alkalibacillus almallahensis]NIK12408.1 exodeoxyribonuclease VII large subunit [Alkalibacillus almallahensis]